MANLTTSLTLWKRSRDVVIKTMNKFSILSQLQLVYGSANGCNHVFIDKVLIDQELFAKNIEDLVTADETN